MDAKPKVNTVLFAGTEYDAQILVAQASTYPQITLSRADIVANPDGVYLSRNLKYAVVAPRDNVNYIVASPCDMSQLPTDSLICYLATKYAIKRAIKGKTVEADIEEQRNYRGNRNFDNARGYSRRDDSYPRGNNNSQRQDYPRDRRSSNSY